MGTFVNVYERSDGYRVFGQLHFSREGAQAGANLVRADKDSPSSARPLYRIHIKEQRRSFQLGHPGQIAIWT
jgi:hypothetical protein